MNWWRWYDLPGDLCQDRDFVGCLWFLIIDKLLPYILFLALILGGIFIAWAGLNYITSQDKEKTKKLKDQILSAILGIIIAFLSFGFIWLLLRGFLERGGDVSQIFSFYVLAQIDTATPRELNCGNVSLPSIFSTSTIPRDIWRTCLLFYISRIITYLLFILFLLGIIIIAWLGVNYIIQPEKSKEFRSKILWGIFWIILASLSFGILQLIRKFFLED